MAKHGKHKMLGGRMMSERQMRKMMAPPKPPVRTPAKPKARKGK